MHPLPAHTHPAALDWILERKITSNTVGLGLVDEVSSWLRSLEPRKISEFLIGGVSADDLPSSFGGKTIEMFRDFLGHASFILPTNMTARFSTSVRNSFTTVRAPRS